MDAYAARYTGYTKVQRLIFIAQKCKARELDAYRLALDALKGANSLNVDLYKKVVNLVGGRLGEAYQLDTAWIEGVEKRASMQKERLENDLQASRTTMAKEAIRLGYQDIGEFYYARGDLDNALKNFVRTRDYCSLTRHNVEMCLNVIKVSVDLNSFTHVNNYVSKAEHTPDLNDPKALAKLKAASGLSQLSQQHYAAAARKFLDCTPEGLGKTAPQDAAGAFSQVMAAEDVAVYGGLCALASFDRGELKSRVVDNLPFKGLLDLVPAMRELIYDFCSSRYGSCLRALGEMRPEMQLDLHLHSHVAPLYKRIRERCLLQFFAPYLSVDLRRMAEAFHSPLEELEGEVAELIMTNRLPARVDSQNKTLHRRQVNQRDEGYKKVFALGQDFLREVRAMLLRTSLLEQGVYVEGGGGGSGSGTGSGRGERGGGGGGGSRSLLSGLLHQHPQPGYSRHVFGGGHDPMAEGGSSSPEEEDMVDSEGVPNMQDADNNMMLGDN